jgi:hypothetical protein
MLKTWQVLVLSGTMLVAASAASAESGGYRPGMLGVNTQLPVNRSYMNPSPAPTSPSRGIPSEFKPHYQPATPFQDAIRDPIKPPPPPPPPPVRLENPAPKQVTISTPTQIGRDSVVTPSVTVTPPDLKPNGQGGSIDGAGISITGPMPGGEPKAPGK